LLALVPDTRPMDRVIMLPPNDREQQLLEKVALLEARLAERDALLDEVNHRAKNSLQRAMSLLRLQAQLDADPRVREALSRAAERLGHIAAVHEMLYEHETDGQSVDLHRYLERMRDALVEAHQRPGVQVSVKGEPMVLDAQRTVRLALIAGEAIINSYKYAFPSGEGHIRVAVGRVGSEGKLTVSDDGVGFPAEARKGSLGMRLMRVLGQAIGGRVRVVSSSSGTTVAASFPLER